MLFKDCWEVDGGISLDNLLGISTGESVPSTDAADFPVGSLFLRGGITPELYLKKDISTWNKIVSKKGTVTNNQLPIWSDDELIGSDKLNFDTTTNNLHIDGSLQLKNGNNVDTIINDVNSDSTSAIVTQHAVKNYVVNATDVPRCPIYFWEYNTNATPKYFYMFGSVKSDASPFIVSQQCKLKEFTCAGKLNNVDACVLYALYRTTESLPTIGSLPTAVNQGLTYQESDYPYAGSTRVTIQLVNNGSSNSLEFSENLLTKNVTIQLETNAGGAVTTTATQLRNAFRLNTTITLIYAIDGSGTSSLTPSSFSTSGGSLGDEIASVFQRAKLYGISYYDLDLNIGDVIYHRHANQNRASVASPHCFMYISFVGA